jgi:hypothetical protein
VALQNSFDAGVKLDDFYNAAVRAIYRSHQGLAAHQQKADLRPPLLFEDFHKARMGASGILAKFFYRNIEILGQFSARIGIPGMFFQLDSVDVMLGHFEFLSHFPRGNTTFQAAQVNDI